MIHTLKNKVLKKYEVSRDEAMQLVHGELDTLCNAANEIRMFFCKNSFDICTIINGKSGMCSENCKYCAQSSHYHGKADEYPLLGSDEIVKDALYNHSKGILRYSVVTSGRTLSESEVGQICDSYIHLGESFESALCR